MLTINYKLNIILKYYNINQNLTTYKYYDYYKTIYILNIECNIVHIKNYINVYILINVLSTFKLLSKFYYVLIFT